MKEKNEKVCGNCKWCKWYEDYAEEGFACHNKDSEFYMDFTMYDDSCDDWEEN